MYNSKLNPFLKINSKIEVGRSSKINKINFYQLELIEMF